MEMRHGQWSDGSIPKALTEVEGKEIVQAALEKTQSSFSRRGEGCCWLDQVNFLPISSISLRPRKLIASLNIAISDIEPPSLFLFFGFLIRLKSPVIIQAES